MKQHRHSSKHALKPAAPNIHNLSSHVIIARSKWRSDRNTDLSVKRERAILLLLLLLHWS